MSGTNISGTNKGASTVVGDFNRDGRQDSATVLVDKVTRKVSAQVNIAANRAKGTPQFRYDALVKCEAPDGSTVKDSFDTRGRPSFTMACTPDDPKRMAKIVAKQLTQIYEKTK